MAGLYVNEELESGKFSLKNIQKQHMDSTGSVFDATYTFTSNPISGWSDPVGYTPEAFDSTRVLFGDSTFDFMLSVPSEVFVEGGNILGIESREQGTPMCYDESARQLVSENTGKTLKTILAGNKPMFGEKNNVCPLNMTITIPDYETYSGSGSGDNTADSADPSNPADSDDGNDEENLIYFNVSSIFGGGSGSGPYGPNASMAALRDFRDSVLLDHPVGMAIADSYYRVAPPIARFLFENPKVWAFAKKTVSAAAWVWTHGEVLFIMTLALFLTALGVESKRLRKSVVSRILVVAAVLALGATAHARLLHMSDEDKVEASDSVMTGTVESVDSFYLSEGVIVTDITVRIKDNMKGRLNKGGQIVVRQKGGRVGPIMQLVTEMPEFKAGEETLLFLKHSKSMGSQVICGRMGKLAIVADPKTGKKYVKTNARATFSGGTKKAGGASSKEVVALEDYKAYLRDIDKAQKAVEKDAAPETAEAE